MKKIIFFLVVLIAGGMGSITSAYTVVDQGSTIYSNSLNVSFLQDANYAHTTEYVVIVPSMDPPYWAESTAGGMTYNDGLEFLQTLNDAGYLGVHTWRMPTLAEMQYLRNDGIHFEGFYGGSPWQDPFENLEMYYWVNNAGTADMGDGSEDSDAYAGAAYRYVFPTHSGPAVPTFGYSLFRMYDPGLRRYLFYTSAVPDSTLFIWSGPTGQTPNEGILGFEEIICTALNKGGRGYGAVPEPATMLLLGLGLVGLAGVRRRMR